MRSMAITVAGWTVGACVFLIVSVLVAPALLGSHGCPGDVLRGETGGPVGVSVTWMVIGAFATGSLLFGLGLPQDSFPRPAVRRLIIAAGLGGMGVAALLWANSREIYSCLTPRVLVSRDGLFSPVRQRSLDTLVEVQAECLRTKANTYLSYRLIFSDGYVASEPVADWRGVYKDQPLLQDLLSRTPAKWISSIDLSGRTCPQAAAAFGPSHGGPPP